MFDGFGPTPALPRRLQDPARRRIAVVGSGIAGLSTAWLLAGRHDIDLYEADTRLGGHSNTVDVALDGYIVPVDTGFIVYNERNYPNLTRLFATLGIETDPSCMSFSVSVGDGAIEYCGAGGLCGVFAQPRNLVRPEFWRMLRDIERFFEELREETGDAQLEGLTLGDLLAQGRYGRAFADLHLLPMAAAIWSGPVSAMLDFPALSFVRFFRNHGLLQFRGRPQWRTVAGGSRRYVERMAQDLEGRVRLGSPVTRIVRHDAGVVVHARSLARLYDDVVVACHADQALAMLQDARDDERRLLGAFRYQRNRAVLHRDRALMPRRRAAWASWNYRASRAGDRTSPVSVTYWLNRLQNLGSAPDIFLSLNPERMPDPALVSVEIDYDHPVFDIAAMSAQRELERIQGGGGVWFCGSYFGYGFHEDALVSGLRVAEALGVPAPWATRLESPRVPNLSAAAE